MRLLNANYALSTSLATGTKVGGPLTLDDPADRAAAAAAGLAGLLIDGGMEGEVGARLARGVHVVAQGAAARLDGLRQRFLDCGGQPLASARWQRAGRRSRVHTRLVQCL